VVGRCLLPLPPLDLDSPDATGGDLTEMTIAPGPGRDLPRGLPLPLRFSALC
jgi:hypothetical protein